MDTTGMQIYRSTFGGRACEIVLGRSSLKPGPVVAWALHVRADGGLEPLYGDRGNLVREYAATPDDAVACMRRRLVALLGEERW
jgi:hypothetical protein